jgi:hypothetical protein
MQGVAEDGDHMLSGDDIIRMAREAGFDVNFDIWAVSVDGVHINKELQHFFNLAYATGAAAERKACARLADAGGDPRPATDPDRYLPGAREVAKLTAQGIAANIRARGNK